MKMSVWMKNDQKFFENPFQLQQDKKMDETTIKRNNFQELHSLD
jgi:hypothetical protein